MMTVSEMIAELQKLPPDAPVKVEGYATNTEDCNGLLIPTAVEGLNDEHGVRAIIWAYIVEETE